MADDLDLPPDWEAALARAEAASRVVVLGPTDAGKSSFIRALLARRPGWPLVDLDPGQKMVGWPGTTSLGRLGAEPGLDRFVWLGSTAVGGFNRLVAAGAALAGEGPFVANTSGYVRGPGARLQAMTVAALRPDLVVAIAPPPEIAGLADLAIERSSRARRKSPAARRAVRQAAFERALAGAVELALPGRFDPSPPAPFESTARPVCCLADAAGEDMVLGLLLGERLLAVPPPRPPAKVRLGSMWGERADDGWTLLEGLKPAWTFP
jgi:polynucleotide 5'-hydroxyl-kinase GRC3/NOL9